MSQMPPPVPPVPPVPHPEDVRVRNEQLARGVCPVCRTEGGLLVEPQGYQLPSGYGMTTTSLQGRVCHACGFLALFA